MNIQPIKQETTMNKATIKMVCVTMTLAISLAVGLVVYSIQSVYVQPVQAVVSGVMAFVMALVSQR